MVTAAIGAVTLLVLTIFVCLFLLSLWSRFVWKPIEHWFAYGWFYRKGVERKYGIDVASYMVNHGYSVRKAQKRVEMDTIERIRERETERREFTARIDCPKCGVFDVHWLIRKGHSGVVRQCRECGHEWDQK